MKRKHKLRLYIILAAAVFYFILLCVLAVVESANDGSTIHGLWDAFWYSLVTLTTVGYGDLAPVTPVGRLIGILFLLLSTSILVTLLGTAISFLTGEAMPMFLLGFQKKKNWYYFADASPEGLTLAKKIYLQDSNGLIIFGVDKNEVEHSVDYPCLYVDTALPKLLKKKKHVGQPCILFLMEENGLMELPSSVHLAELPVKTYVRTADGHDRLPGDIHFFHSYDCCAREYWRAQPLRSTEKHIILVGFGHYGRAILKRAILTNVISNEQAVCYHIFGGAGTFLQIHDHLDEAFSIGKEAKDIDSLIFYEDDWQLHHDVLAKADRVIICEDEDSRCWDTYWHMRRYYVLKGRVDIRSDRDMVGISCFGTYDAIYTPENVLSTKLNEVAIAMNDLYRKTHPSLALTWDALDDTLRQSKIAAADHLLMKARVLLEDENIRSLTPNVLRRSVKAYERVADDPKMLEKTRSMEHMRWLRFYCYYNWEYDRDRDELNRKDPRVLPYGWLTKEQQAQCDYAWRLMSEISLEAIVR